MSPAQQRTGSIMGPDGTDDGFRYAKARAPMSAPAAAPIAILLALAVLALGVLAVRDGLVEFGVMDGTPYLSEFARSIDGLTAQTWMFWAGVGAAVLGLILLYLAVKRRRRLGVQVDSEIAMFARPADVARLATETSTSMPDVLSASTSASRKKVKVTVNTADRANSELRTRVSDAVKERLSPLKSPPRVSVRANGGVGR